MHPVGPAFKRQIVAWIAAWEKYQLALILKTLSSRAIDYNKGAHLEKGLLKRIESHLGIEHLLKNYPYILNSFRAIEINLHTNPR